MTHPAARPTAAQATPISDADNSLAKIAIGFELAVSDLYQAVIDAGATAAPWEILRNQHSSYAERIAGVTGISAKVRDDTFYAANVDDFSGSHPANAAFAVENVAAATHAELLVDVVDPGIIDALAAIASMESRHAAYLAERSGRGDNFEALFVNTAAPYVAKATS